MTRRFTPLDPEITRGAHPVSSLTEAGVTVHERRGPLWRSDHRGLWFWAPGAGDAASERIGRIAPLLPAGAAIGGWAAAHILGATQIDGFGPDGGHLPVPLCLGRQQTVRRLGGLVRWRSDLLPGEVHHVSGVPVTSPGRTCFDLLRRADSLEDAVAWGDALLSEVRVDLEAVAKMLAGRDRWLGIPRARAAFPLLDPRVRSMPESRLRMLWTHAAGLPRPEVNARLVDHEGRRLGELDLFDPEAGVAAEYDGRHHSDAAQRSVDHARDERLRRAGISVLRCTSTDLTARRARTVHRLRAAHAAGLARDPRLDGWVLLATPDHRRG